MFKLNTARTYKWPVTITVLDGDQELSGTVTVTYRPLASDKAKNPDNASRPLLDLVLVDVDGIEVTGEDGHVLTGDARLSALRNDPAAAVALTEGYFASVQKKATKPS